MILIIIAIVLAKNKPGTAWILWGIEAGLSLLALIGRGAQYSAMGYYVDMSTAWIVYIVIVLVSGLIIRSRAGGNGNKNADNTASNPSVYSRNESSVSGQYDGVNVSQVTPLQERVLVPEIDDDDFYDEKTVASFEDVTVPIEDDDKTLPFFMEEKPAHKVVLTRCSDGYRIECTGDLFSVGKSLNSSNYVIPGSQKISRLHATFYEKDGNYFIMDNSKNGTTVNGKAVSKTQQIPVKDGDKIKFADLEFIFNIE